MSSEVLRASEVTLQAVFRRSARIFADRVALIDGVGQHTYRTIERNALGLVGALQARGLRKGDRIAILSEPRRAYVELYVAAAYAGLTVVALNTRLHERARGVHRGRPAARALPGRGFRTCRRGRL